MFKKALLATVLGAALVATPAMSAPKNSGAAKTPTIAVLNLPLIMNEIPQAKALQESMAKEFGAREREMQKMQQEGVKLSQDLAAGKYKGEQLTKKRRDLEQLQADFRIKGRALQEDQQKFAQEKERDLMMTVQRAIDSIAQDRGIDLVIRGDAVAFANPDFDISQEVIKRVSADKGTKSSSKKKK